MNQDYQNAHGALIFLYISPLSADKKRGRREKQKQKTPEKIKRKPIKTSVSDSTKLGTEIFLIKTEILYKRNFSPLIQAPSSD
jgi:hypothetical protein